ncbi:MAG TPA: endonuclease/exonuclease/phosphatase family protein [Pyrinomonadaceae bacterium]|jgi:endonuclease/exonuclease/phosphatase family metal-dependent hydrolase
MNKIRIATYNIHKCVGIDRRFSPERIAEVLQEIDADVIALQEVLCHKNADRRTHQAEFIADELNMDFFLGENRRIQGGSYGNAVLTRLPVRHSQNFDISINKYEPRGCLLTEIELGQHDSLQFFNVHLGTSFFERRRQVHRLLHAHVLEHARFTGKRIVAGDFNEWTHGLTTKLFKTKFQAVDAKAHLGVTRTFPGILPIFHLDHIYFDKNFRLANAFLHKSRTARFASDHLPIVAEFEF